VREAFWIISNEVRSHTYTIPRSLFKALLVTVFVSGWHMKSGYSVWYGISKMQLQVIMITINSVHQLLSEHWH